MRYIFSLYIGIFLGLIALNYINISNNSHGNEVVKRDINIIVPISFDDFSNEILNGEASYYSRNGCVGCSSGLLMRNQEPLDDNRNTIALSPEMVAENGLLNKIVVVENLETGKQVFARVTDTGGFKKYNRVADLSLYTKKALGCGGLCQVSVKTR